MKRSNFRISLAWNIRQWSHWLKGASTLQRGVLPAIGCGISFVLKTEHLPFAR